VTGEASIPVVNPDPVQITSRNLKGERLGLFTDMGQPVFVGSKHRSRDSSKVYTILAADYGHRQGGSYATVDTDGRGSLLCQSFGFEFKPI